MVGGFSLNLYWGATMYVMTSQEVAKYFFARENLRRAEYEVSQDTEELYEKIYPTRTIFDTQLRKISCKSSNVEMMALYIVSKKEAFQKYLKRKRYLVECHDEWITTLTQHEGILFHRLKRNRRARKMLIDDIRLKEAKAKLTEIAYLQHLREEVLRNVRDKKAEVKETQFVREFYAKETKRNIAMGKKHVFSGYHFQWLSGEEIRQLKLDEESKKIAEEKRKAEWEAFMSRRISDKVTDNSIAGGG